MFFDSRMGIYRIYIYLIYIGPTVLSLYIGTVWASGESLPLLQNGQRTHGERPRIRMELVICDRNSVLKGKLLNGGLLAIID